MSPAFAGVDVSMRWPWTRRGLGEQLVLSWSAQTLAYVLACSHADGSYKVIKYGVEQMGPEGADELFRRLNGLLPKGLDVRVMLRPEQYQMVQIEAPTVEPDELRAAARYKVREMLHAHMDDVTLDVMRVGDGQQKGAGHLFVVAATNAVIRSILDLSEAMRWTVSVIDIQETAQRNLQNALTAREGRNDHANVALVLLDQHQALLTISAHEELFYARRFDLPAGFLVQPLAQDAALWTVDPANVPGDSRHAAASSPYQFIDGLLPELAAANSALAPGSETLVAIGAIEKDSSAQRFLVEVQRSLDLWDRVWSGVPLHGIRVYAGERSQALSAWLSSQLGQTVIPMDINTLFPGFEEGASGDKALCLPLLGLLLRTENRTL